ncbi:Copia protein [Trametes pubescens]|uniref:Copia protein n=1 Tax=Trametes pubescens TaxID=154538 RepID=A0A1M2VRC7_TRAPU|nr:Copia protein [Trametes pubescens]
MHEDRKAISGYACLIDGGTVSWSSKCQELISLSTTESEYVAVTHAAKEALWLCSLIGQVFTPFIDPITLNSDNQSAITLAHDNQYHAHTKHIDIRYHFIHWVIKDKKIHLVYCPTEDMVADVLTKALPSPKVKHFAATLGLL